MSGAKSMFSKSNGGSTPPPSSEEISAYLGKETVFEGKMTFEGVFRLDGKFDGEIFESGTLVVGETAVVKGKIMLNTIVINGVVEGDICASGRVEIHSTGKVYGTLLTPVLLINEGGIFEGNCKMKGSSDRKEESGKLPSSKTDNIIST